MAVLKSQPASWNALTDDVLKLDARESYDPEGQALVFDWSASNLGEIELRPFGQARAEAVFTRPGLYAFTVKVTDEEGNLSRVEREAAVHGANGFSGFGCQLLARLGSAGLDDHRITLYRPADILRHMNCNTHQRIGCVLGAEAAAAELRAQYKVFFLDAGDAGNTRNCEG